MPKYCVPLTGYANASVVVETDETDPEKILEEALVGLREVPVPSGQGCQGAVRPAARTCENGLDGALARSLRDQHSHRSRQRDGVLLAKGVPGVCAQCSGWGRDHSLEVGDEWEPVTNKDGQPEAYEVEG